MRRLLDSMTSTQLADLQVGDLVSVTGTLRSPAPLIAPYARIPVAWYNHVAHARLAEGAYETVKTRQHAAIRGESKTEMTEAYLEADGVKVRLDLSQAEIEPVVLGGGVQAGG